jgi:hypothetical protein
MKSPKTADNSRPFLGFSLSAKGYVEKCLLPITKSPPIKHFLHLSQKNYIVNLLSLLMICWPHKMKTDLFYRFYIMILL